MTKLSFDFILGENMIPLQQICLYLDDLLQSCTFEDYGPNGLQIQGCKDISRIATAVSVSMETIQKAIDLQVQVLLVHHGFFWNRDSYVIQGTKRDKLQLLLANGISLLAYHLPLDAHVELGNNWKAAKDMGWKQLQPFGRVNGVPIGVRGVVDYSREEFKKVLEGYYQHPAHCAWGGKERVHSVALISGGAHKQIGEAAAQGMDGYVTGSFDEPVWHTAHEEKINFYALGHSATERIGPQALAQHLEQKFRIPAIFIDEKNPF